MVPPLEALFQTLPARSYASRVTIRASANTGQTLALYDDETGALEEVVAGFKFRITGRAFFQNNTAGAEVLVTLVREALQPRRSDVMIDGYAGGGLFSVTVGRACERVIGVESDRVAAADFEHNVGHRALRREFESSASLLPKAFDLAVVDPPRSGLGKEGVAVLAGGRPRRIAYVSCDPASFARDASLLGERGYALDWVQPVDMFPQTFQVEIVGCFVGGMA